MCSTSGATCSSACLASGANMRSGNGVGSLRSNKTRPLKAFNARIFTRRSTNAEPILHEFYAVQSKRCLPLRQCTATSARNEKEAEEDGTTTRNIVRKATIKRRSTSGKSGRNWSRITQSKLKQKSEQLEVDSEKPGYQGSSQSAKNTKAGVDSPKERVESPIDKVSKQRPPGDGIYSREDWKRCARKGAPTSAPPSAPSTRTSTVSLAASSPTTTSPTTTSRTTASPTVASPTTASPVSPGDGHLSEEWQFHARKGVPSIGSNAPISSGQTDADGRTNNKSSGRTSGGKKGDPNRDVAKAKKIVKGIISREVSASSSQPSKQRKIVVRKTQDVETQGEAHHERQQRVGPARKKYRNSKFEGSGPRIKLQKTVYLTKNLKAEEDRGYKSAGVLLYHVGNIEGVENVHANDVHLLLALQSTDYHKENKGVKNRLQVQNALTLLGGKRKGEDMCAIWTAAREVEEETGGLLQLRREDHNEPTAICWNPTAKYVVFLQEARPVDLKLPVRYLKYYSSHQKAIRENNDDETLEIAEVSTIMWVSLKRLLAKDGPKLHPYVLKPLMKSNSLLVKLLLELRTKKLQSLQREQREQQQEEN